MKKSVRKIKTIDQNTTVLRADDSEEVNYNFPGFPAYIRRGLLSHYPDYSFISHWHEDLEFIVVFSGEMQYNVNGEILTLQAGEGLVVSSRQLHYGFSDEHRECDFLCVLLHPLLFCSTPAVEQAYIAPLRDAPPFAWLKLRKEQEWQQELMSLLIQMDEKSQESHPLLALQSLGFSVWDLLFSHTLGGNTTEKKHVPRQLTALKDMLHFIQVHYDDKISLEEIADAGHVCKSSCNEIFHHYLQQSPIACLIDHRLRKSAELLEQTDLTVLEISTASGFSSASYFTKTFRERFGLSPREYRRRRGNPIPSAAQSPPSPRKS